MLMKMGFGKMVLVHDHNGVFFVGIFAVLELPYVVAFLKLLYSVPFDGFLVVVFDGMVRLSGPLGAGLWSASSRLPSEFLWDRTLVVVVVGLISSWSPLNLGWSVVVSGWVVPLLR